MDITEIAKKILPTRLQDSLKRARKKAQRARIEKLPVLTEKDFTDILTGELWLKEGDAVYVGSSVDGLNLGFPFYRILPLIQDVIGPKGTVVFPTYPNRSPVSSYQYLLRGNIFDVRRTPSYTGLLSEFARRQRGASRSLHPTKSVCAIGRYAEELTREHQLSPYPYDANSPYYKLVEHNAKIIGLGIWTEYMSFVYTIDDALKERAPVQTYHPQIFAAVCINYKGERETVETYAHDMSKVVHDVPQYMKNYIPPEVCSDLRVKGMKFFRADAARLFDEMLRLAKKGITVYPRSVYSKNFTEE